MHVVDSLFAQPGTAFGFTTELNESIYAVESPDALRPAGEGATLLIRYDENNLRAGVGYRGDHRVVTLGFPFEAVPTRGQRHRLMNRILAYLNAP